MTANNVTLETQFNSLCTKVLGEELTKKFSFAVGMCDRDSRYCGLDQRITNAVGTFNSLQRNFAKGATKEADARRHLERIRDDIAPYISNFMEQAKTLIPV